MTVGAAAVPRDWEAAAPEVSVRRILKVHGYKDPAVVRRPILRAAEAAAAAARDVAAPRAAYLRCGVARVAGDTLELEDGTRFSGATFERVLGDCREVVAFVLTLGAAFDAAITERIEDAPVEALFLDTAGWLTVERSTRELAQHLDDRLAPAVRTGARLGPGYDYRGETGRQSWPLVEQRELFSLFGGAALPVELLESCAMMPKMSRSGLFGLVSRQDETDVHTEGMTAR